MTQRSATIKLPLTCGELVQGTYRGTPSLVSCPIHRYHRVELSLQKGADWTFPINAPKTRRAFRNGLVIRKAQEWGGTLALHAPAPVQRGYGTSTADIGAALYALGEALGQPFGAAEAADVAVKIEPSDSTLFPGLTVFDHRNATYHEHWGETPPLAVIVFDPGGGVDTLAFNRRDFSQELKKLHSQHRDAFQLLKEGLANKDWQALGQAATLSARAHQEILHNPALDHVQKLGEEIHALGLCRAHSGTLLGLLLDPTQIDISTATDHISQHLSAEGHITRSMMVGGGPRKAD